MVAGKSFAVLTQRQESQIGNQSIFLIGYTYKLESLGVNAFIYIDKK